MHEALAAGAFSRHTLGSLSLTMGARGARSSGPIVGEPLTPLQSDEDAPVSKWMEDAALSRAQSVRHGSDDWEPQLGDGRKQNAQHSIEALSGERSPRFEMPGMDVRRSSARHRTSVEPCAGQCSLTPRDGCVGWR